MIQKSKVTLYVKYKMDTEVTNPMIGVSTATLNKTMILG